MLIGENRRRFYMVGASISSKPLAIKYLKWSDPKGKALAEVRNSRRLVFVSRMNILLEEFCVVQRSHRGI
jgi:hypothetical protein